MDDTISRQVEVAQPENTCENSYEVERSADDCIRRQNAVDAIKRSRFLVDAMEKVIKLSPAQPERKIGRWIHKPYIRGIAYCSECNFELHINDTPYCPYCGTDMRGEQDE